MDETKQNKLARILQENEGAAFGVYPNAGKRTNRIPLRSPDSPIDWSIAPQLLRGMFASTMGLGGDGEKIGRSIIKAGAAPGSYVDRNMGSDSFLPNSDDFMERLPFKPETDAGKLAGGMGTLLGIPGVGITGKAAVASAPAAKWLGKEALRPVNDAILYGEGPMRKFIPKAPNIVAWHGSPHKFDAFDASKIGTGEGAQAYGHGLYLADNQAVAKGYQTALAGPGVVTKAGARLSDSDPVQMNAALLVQHFGGDIKRASIEAKKYAAELDPQQAAIFKSVSDTLDSGAVAHQPQGALYKVDLPDEHIAKMLDWDKPLGQQTPHVQQAIEKTKSMLPPNAMDDLGGDLSLMYGKSVTPNQFLNTWEQFGTVGSGEAALAKHGVPGSRYLDGGSRAAGKGSSNYVLFPGNEHMATILERNGQMINTPKASMVPNSNRLSDILGK